MSQQNLQREDEHVGPIWKHPYFLYILLTLVLFLFLVGMPWLAWTNGWIPNRGISTSG
jgi:hypothetical protein